MLNDGFWMLDVGRWMLDCGIVGLLDVGFGYCGTLIGPG
jgi:hypothetical protein